MTSELKHLALLVIARGLLAELEDRTNEAAGWYAMDIRLGNRISRGGFVFHRLVGIGIEETGIAPLARIAPRLRAAQARSVIAELEKVDAERVRWSEVVRNENSFMFYRILKGGNPLALVTGWFSALKVRPTVRDKHEGAVARVRLLLTELALFRCRSENGAPPAALAGLVPKYLQRVPLDPFTGRALVYRCRGTNWSLYSVGPDRADNGGRAFNQRSKRGDISLDHYWQMPLRFVGLKPD